MAKQDTGYLGGFRGNLGPAVGYQWRGKWCVRSKPGIVRNPRTDKQMKHRWMFREEVRLAADMLDVLHLGLRERSLAMGMTECNLFVQCNQEAFGWEECEPVADALGSGDGNGTLTVDYQRLVVSAGDVPTVDFDMPHIDDRLVLTVGYQQYVGRQWGSSEDLVYLYIYCPSLNDGMLAAPSLRRQKRIAVALPEEWQGREVHIWGFVQDYMGRASDSIYLGGGPLEPFVTEDTEDEEIGVADTTNGGGVESPEVSCMPLHGEAHTSAGADSAPPSPY